MHAPVPEVAGHIMRRATRAIRNPALALAEQGLIPDPSFNAAMRVNPLYLSNALNACCFMTAEGARLAVSLYALHLHASPAVVGLLASLFSIVPAASSVPAGRWMDRVGPRRPMLVSALLLAPAAALAFFWRDLAALFIVAVLVGAAQNLFLLGNLHILGRLGAPENRVHNFSVFTTANAVAAFVSPLLVGFTIDLLGHSSIFLILGLMPLVPAAAIAAGWLAFPDEPAHRATGPGAAQRRAGAFSLLRDPALRGIFAIAFASSSCTLLYFFLTPLYGVTINLSASSIGVVLSSFSIAIVAVRLLAPALARRVRSWRLILSAMSASGLLLLCVPLVENVAGLMAIGLLLGAGMGLSSPLVLALMSEHAPDHRVGEVLGLRMTMVNIILTAVPLLAGALGAAIGVAPVFWITSALLLGSCFFSRERWHTRRHAG